MVSSRSTGPRGLNGASPFIWAQPDRDIDPKLVASDGMGNGDCTRQRRRTEAIDGDRRNGVRKTGGEGTPSCDVAHPFVRGVDTTGGDVLIVVGRDARPLAGRDHRPSQKIIGTQVREGAPVPSNWCSNAPENESISHELDLH